MDLEEELMAPAAVIYAALLTDMLSEMRGRGKSGYPSTEWERVAMNTAAAHALLLRSHVREVISTMNQVSE